jgi:hypothetical protein
MLATHPHLNEPEDTHVTKGLRLRRYIRITARIDLGARRRAPNTTCPVTAESNIEYLPCY